MNVAQTIGVLLADGTNCHEETVRAIEDAGHPAEIVLLREMLEHPRLLLDRPAIVIPGGFSFGDHFGAGRALALIIGEYLRQFKAFDRPVLGICNGLQVLMEAGLFENGEDSGGALVANLSEKFESRWANLIALKGSPWTAGYEGQILRMPVAHGEGRWRVPANSTRHLVATFRYCDKDGRPTATHQYPDNPNGSPGGITGLAHGLVMGMMPHPERACDLDLGSADGRLIFNALVRLTKAA